MTRLKIINRYIFLELMFPFLVSLFFLTFVFLMTRIPEITNIVVNYNADISVVLKMVLFTLPRFLEFTIPMSVMISVLLTFMRMSGENELVALKGAGVSLYRLLPPVLSFCILGLILCMWITVFGVSWGKLAIKKTSLELARSSIDMALQERQFNSALENIMIYVSHVDMKSRALKDVFIEDRRTKGVVSISIAPSGRLIQLENEQFYTIRLYQGMINQVDTDENSVSTIRFGEYDINIDLAVMGQGNQTLSKELDERNIVDLIRFIRTNKLDKTHLSEALMELHEKFSIPFACLCLGVLALPLGVQSASLRRSSGFGMGIFFFLVYYALLTAGWSAGETGHFPPVLGMWLPNFVMGGAAIFFLIRNAKENPVPMPGFILQSIEVVKKWFQRKTNDHLSA